ncbi:MAG TPA: Si-specific NAD(P)(+) transhydrogenase [Candidatus Sulfotelmatobacter sp.]|nr:Si-specific NAD(P)(+) transhydrogenase [Candidatus Sulfotelmatobacter sp.]
MKTYDLVVIGGGPAGISAARTAVIHGKTVALVNRVVELGGATVNTGTLPSKTLRETALALSGVQARNLTGLDVSLRREANVADFLHHEQDVKTGFNATLAQWTQALKIDLFPGTASFETPNTVRVKSNANGEQTIQGEKILIATGSSPLRPPPFPFDRPEIYDSDTILNLDCLPKKLAVVGAGVIGSEYACIFAALGVEVHLIDGRDTLLPFLDAEVSQALAVAMERNGIVLHRNERIQGCVVTGPNQIDLKLSSGAELQVGAVLVAAGRKSNTAELNLPAVGVALGEHGLIKVDEFYCTSAPHIYAAGDVIGFPALASTSLEQGHRAMRHAFNLEARAGLPSLLPTGIFTIPEVSMVGETEETLKKKGIDYVVGRWPFSNSIRGRIIGDTNGFLKLLFRKNDLKLLGVHVLGEHATEMVHVGLIAMLAGATARIFDEACFNLPTLSEIYKFAARTVLLERAGANHLEVFQQFKAQI